MTSQEESDLAKAIALSLKEAEGRKSPKKSKLYPSAEEASKKNDNSDVSKSQLFQEPRKVKALYDFEAAEDNEVTFKAGEVVSVLDDSDPNWWRGSTWRGEGLFPANFVTADLNAEIEYETKRKKSVSFDNEVKVVEAAPVLELDEAKINETLDMIQNEDPTAEEDPMNLLQAEEQCKLMAPLIDQKLEQVDKHHITLMNLNARLSDAFQMYTSLMTQTTTHLPQPPTHLPQPPTHLPQPTTHLPQPPTHLPQPTTHLPHPIGHLPQALGQPLSNAYQPPNPPFQAPFNTGDYQIANALSGQYQPVPYAAQPQQQQQQQQQLDSTTTLMANTTISDQNSSFQQQPQQYPYGQPFMQTPASNLLQ